MTLKFWKYLITRCNGSAIYTLLPKKTVSGLRRNWNVIRAFSAIQRYHNLNAQYSALLRNEFCSSFGEYG